jgi:hypothetical protein
MARTVKIERELFEAMLRKMINAKPVPLAKIPKSKKNLSRMMEPVIPAHYRPAPCTPSLSRALIRFKRKDPTTPL